MSVRIDTAQASAVVRTLPEDVIRAFADALREELEAGHAVRIRKLGMWTPYIGDNGRQSVAFHSEIALRRSETQEQQADESMHTSERDIPFVDEQTPHRKPRHSQHAALIDVPLLFDEVREEFGLLHLPIVPQKPTIAAQDTDPLELQPSNGEAPQFVAAPSAQDFGEPFDEAGNEDDILAEDDLPMEASHVDAASRVDEGGLANSDIASNEAVFRMNRERLFNPPEPRQSNGMRKAAAIMTVIMVAMLGYLVYNAGMLNGVLPQNLQYRPVPLERRITPERTQTPVPQQGTEAIGS